MTRPIFVFGSNTAGIHGAGAARYAYTHEGAEGGVGVGLTGNSYALPTKDSRLRSLPLYIIKGYVQDLLDFATANPSMTFKVTRIGCGLAGYTDAEIAPMFKGAPLNCTFDTLWQPYLGNEYTYWGTC